MVQSFSKKWCEKCARAGRKCARAGEREGTAIFPANNVFPRSCPSFSLGLFYFHNVSQIQAKGITLQCASPRKEFTFWLFAPWFWYFWHSFATRLSTLLLNYWFAQPKRLLFFIKNLNLFSFLLYQQKKIPLHKLCTFIFLHALFWNYIKIWCYLLTLLFLLLFTFFFSLKNDHLYNFFYSEVRFSRQCSMYSWVKLYLVIIPTSWNKKTEQVCLSDPIYMEKSCLGRVEGHATLGEPSF